MTAAPLLDAPATTTTTPRADVAALEAAFRAPAYGEGATTPGSRLAEAVVAALFAALVVGCLALVVLSITA